MLISTNPSSPLIQQQVIKSTHRDPAPLPEQAGSFVPLAISATAGLNIQGVQNEDLFDIVGCFRCGGNHREAVCQEKDPWEYIAPYFDSVDFGQGFFSIPVI
jgi:hypothetical protein